MALELRPNCEYCNKDLSPDAAEARICTYECTFCAQCVDTVLFNVCPNCGGGFVPRPIRPAIEHRPGLSLAKRARLRHAHASFLRSRGGCALCPNAARHSSGGPLNEASDVIVSAGTAL